MKVPSSIVSHDDEVEWKLNGMKEEKKKKSSLLCTIIPTLIAFVIKFSLERFFSSFVFSSRCSLRCCLVYNRSFLLLLLLLFIFCFCAWYLFFLSGVFLPPEGNRLINKHFSFSKHFHIQHNTKQHKTEHYFHGNILLENVSSFLPLMEGIKIKSKKFPPWKW